jgi:hypothetical protein
MPLTVATKEVQLGASHTPVKVAKKAKKIGVVGISKAENVQLGLILRWVALELDWDTIPNEVLVDPEALTKLIGRFQIKAK